MPIFTIQAPDGRKIRIEAGDENTAMRGAQEWASANPIQKPAMAPTGADGRAMPPAGLQPGTREYADWAAQQARAAVANNQRPNLPQVSAPPPENQSSLLDPFVQGVTFGFGDELRGAVQGGMAAAQGGDFGSVYTQSVDESRNALDRERRVNPLGSVAAEVAGAIPTGMVAGGQLAGRGATLGQRVMSTGLTGAAQGAAYGAGASREGERGVGAFTGGLVGGAAGAAVPVAGNAISSFIQKAQQGRVLDAAAKVAPTADDLRSAASNMFEQATGGSPLAITDNSYMRLLGDVQSFGQKLRINPNLDPKSIGLWEMMRTIADDAAAGGVVIDMKDLHLLRQAAQRVAMSSEGRDAAFANSVIGKLDDFIQTLKPADILGGSDPSQATKALYTGISTWSRANKVGLIEEAIRKGQSAASGPEKGIRNALRTMLFNKPDVWSRFSSAEQQAIKDVIDGTPGSNFMKLVGTFGFGGNTATNGIGGAAGMALGQMAAGPVGMVAGPVLGSIGRNASERLTEGLANRAMGAAATEGLKVLPRIDPNSATPIEVLMRRAITPNASFPTR